MKCQRNWSHSEGRFCRCWLILQKEWFHWCWSSHKKALKLTDLSFQSFCTPYWLFGTFFSKKLLLKWTIYFDLYDNLWCYNAYKSTKMNHKGKIKSFTIHTEIVFFSISDGLNNQIQIGILKYFSQVLIFWI